MSGWKDFNKYKKSDIKKELIQHLKIGDRIDFLFFQYEDKYILIVKNTYSAKDIKTKFKENFGITELKKNSNGQYDRSGTLLEYLNKTNIGKVKDLFYANNNDTIFLIDYNDTLEGLKQNITNIKRTEHQVKKPVIPYENNTIIYGPPGTGKSFQIKDKLKHLSKDQITVVTFHPEYTYGDFVGKLVPSIKDKNPTYRIQEGAFIQTLKKSINDDQNDYYLIIEEINRGNCASIFGDIFQLLDRDEDNNSEYSINNELIKNQLELNEKQEIRIPKNMYIIATMNTSDQNLFPMDSAFKRRWDLLYINSENDENTKNMKALENQEWEDLRARVNKKILEITGSEDKQIGKYFITEKKRNESNIKNKLYEYLYNDVFKFHRKKVFPEKTFTQLYNTPTSDLFKDKTEN